MNISKKAIEILKQIAEQRITQDNLATRNPLYIVQTRRERIVDPTYSSVDIERIKIEPITAGEYILPSLEDIKEGYLRESDLPCSLVFKIEKSETLEEVQELLETYFTDGEDIEIIQCEYYWENIAYFLVLEEAKRYQEYQKHNLGVNRIYAECIGYSNYGLFAQFLDMLDKGEVFEK